MSYFFAFYFCFQTVQFSSLTQSCLTLSNAMTAACQLSLSITNSQSLLKLMSIESVMSSNNLIICCPLLLLPSIPPSNRVFSNKSVLHIRCPKYWSFSFSISHQYSNECSGLISFRFDLLAVQGTVKSLQHHSSKASVLWHSTFFMVLLCLMSESLSGKRESFQDNATHKKREVYY